LVGEFVCIHGSGTALRSLPKRRVAAAPYAC
jgi:hypothetical protein